MKGTTQEQPLSPVPALEILEGQVATVYHIMALETANPSVHVLRPRQVWKANFIAYFLGAVTKSQLVVTQQLGGESYAAA